MDEREQNVKESELRGGLNRLEKDASDLCARVKELGSKLSPVMREIQDQPTAETPGEDKYSPTGQQIKTITYTVNETADRVQEILQHLEV